MRCAPILIGFGMLLGACGGAVPPPQAEPARAVEVAPAPPLPPRVTGCRAEPSTVYGTEPVVFVIEAPESSGKVDVSLVDQRQQSVSQGATAAPGRWRLTDVPSGDFVLRTGQNGATCTVTVNRELSRASETPR